VEDWAEFLRTAQPARSVRVERLRGAHCQLHRANKAGYAAAVQTLVTEALDEANAPPPPPGSDEALAALLSACDLGHLAEPLAVASESLTGCLQRLQTDGRPKLLTHLKGVGIATLAERQKLASALAKKLKEEPVPCS
jgi:hypothetical protein